MKILGKTKAFQESFFNLQRMPVYMPASLETRWFLTDTEKNFDKNKHITPYGADDVFYKFNRQGFRSIEFEHDSDAINVLIVGESNSIGVGLPYDEVWFNVLGQKLKEQEDIPNIKFFNMSVSSITLDQMSIMINQVYDVIKPDYVVIIGTSFFASSYYKSETDKSTDFLHFSLTAQFDNPEGKLIPDITFIPPELHGISDSFTKDLNLANCFFKSLSAYSFIKRVCGENFLIYFRNPKVYNIDLENEIKKYDSDFSNRFLNFPIPILSPSTCSQSELARDCIHVGKNSHIKIADFILNKLRNNGTLEKWKMKFSSN